MTSKRTDLTRTAERVLNPEAAADRLATAKRDGQVERLDAFLAADAETRSAIWRLATIEARRELVISLGLRNGRDISEAYIVSALEAFDARLGTEPTATEAAIVGALEDAEARHLNASYGAYKQGDDAAGKFFGRERNAAGRALEQYRAGIRAELTEANVWRVRSASSSAVYTVDRAGLCSCKAGANGQPCWHVALVAGTETGLDNPVEDGDGEPAEPVELEYEEAARHIFARIAAERRRVVEML